MKNRLTQAVLRNQRDVFIIVFSLLIFNLFQDFLCAAEILVHVVGASLRRGVQCFVVGHQAFEIALLHIIFATDAPASAAGDDVVSFLELVVVEAEKDGFAEGDGLQYVVDPHPEAAADVGHRGVAVQLGEHADVVDDKNLGGG